MEFIVSEKKVLRKIKKYIKDSINGDIHSSIITGKRYDFWFVYDGDTAISWEGGFNMSLNAEFRNQYSIEEGKKIVKNWS